MMWFATSDGVSRYDGKTLVNLTTKDGLVHNRVGSICRDLNGRLWFGTGNENGDGVSCYDGKTFVNFTTKDGLLPGAKHSIYCDPNGVMWFGNWANMGLSRYDGKGFVNFTIADGLPHNWAWMLYDGDDGQLWIGAMHGGVCHYDENSVVSFTTKDGLPHNSVNAVHRDSNGNMWVATGAAAVWVGANGVTRYDENGVISFTEADGLASNNVGVIDEAADGALWFGTIDWHAGGGVSRYDGKEFVTFTEKDGLASNHVPAIHCSNDGVIWFGTRDAGISRYDGKRVVTFTTRDGLVNNSVSTIYRDRDGAIWFGTYGGVSRYDGEVSGRARDSTPFVNFTEEDGLASNYITAIYQSADGLMWFAMWHRLNGGSGVSHYDGVEFVNLTQNDGLVDNAIRANHQSPDGVLWFGTNGSGVALYDGISWSSLDTRDGLAGNVVRVIHQDEDGSLWFGTDGGLTRYRRRQIKPSVHIVSLEADRIYHDLSAVDPITAGTRITVEYGAIDFLTHPDKRQYRVRLRHGGGRGARWRQGDKEYRKPTKATSFDWIPEKPGDYIFEVQAINRDLNYSEPATLSLTVEPDVRDLRIATMQTEIDHLRREVGSKYHFRDMVGRSAAIKQVSLLMERAIDSGLSVLVTGETGVGKELVAKGIHYNSSRKDNPFLDINCGALPRDLIASTLFGHSKGAFTGAHQDKIGIFEAAEGGTVVLDEIGEMPSETQVHLLRVLEKRKVERVGEYKSRDVDVRILAMTNRNLGKEVQAGRFREDLYYRLNEFPIHIPPLRERTEDIPQLAAHFLKEIDREIDGFAPDVFDMLINYPWPGNVRELRNVVHRAAAFVEEGLRIQTYHFPSQITGGESMIQEEIAQSIGYTETMERFQRRFIEQIVRESNGNRREAARRLKMDASNLLRLMRRLDIR